MSLWSNHLLKATKMFSIQKFNISVIMFISNTINLLVLDGQARGSKPVILSKFYFSFHSQPSTCTPFWLLQQPKTPLSKRERHEKRSNKRDWGYLSYTYGPLLFGSFVVISMGSFSNAPILNLLPERLELHQTDTFHGSEAAERSGLSRQNGERPFGRSAKR
jgi:hypothetical protein